MPDQGEIVLVPVPFTDLTTSRRRPVIVISNNAYHQSTDMIVVAMTSNPNQTSYSFVITSADLVAGTLNHPGTVRADKVFTLARRIVVKSFGRVGQPVLDRIRQLLATAVS